MHVLQTLLVQTGQAFWTAFSGLVWPALVFGLIALIVRGRDALRIAHEATPQIRINLILFAIDIAIVTPLLVMALTYTGGLIQQAGLRLFSADFWSVIPAWTVAIIAIFAGDFIAYWRHRLEHTAFLWPTHAIHHSDTHMTWTTGLRFHPLNRLTTTLIDTTFLALLGLPLWALMINNLTRHFYGLFIHMDLPWTYGPLGRVFVSPAMHRWHHIRDAEGAGVNFATVFSVFDQAFGTYHVPRPCDASLGVHDQIGKGAAGQLAWPLIAAWRALRTPRPKSAHSGA
ncbi:MAG: sterol desaturase family protein [Alphaproteobacteria bacterium]|nr:sterol desaturase family protein [Alphaproteobacteria bacterium]